ncbi:hypothetical protein AAKU67_003250 [Oxalobacteraceae bacterium GrIS 2.11]
MADLHIHSEKLSWCLDDIPFDSIEPSTVHNDEFLFLTLASASFVEILADLYSDNLISHFGGNAEVTGWLAARWQKEEVQHGQALKTYIQLVWPEFDWETAHRAFVDEYRLLCTAEQLESHPGLELIARCVVETGTSTFYRALRSYVQEPVLRQILNHISSDETAHYNHFRRFFQRLNASQPHGLAAVVKTIWRRLYEIRSEDSYIAFKHASIGLHPERPFRAADWIRYSKEVRNLARVHYPYRMAVSMLLKPVPLFKPLKQALQWPLFGLFYMLSH